MKQKTKITISISVVALLLIVVGVSYAYFSAQITGGEDSTTLNVTGGSLGLTVSGGNSITVSNTYPQDGAVATKTITVTGNNTTELTMPYTLNLVIDANTFGSSSIKYTLTSTNTDNTGTIIPSISSQTGITTGTSTISLGSGSFEGDTTNKVHTYVLNIYYPDTGASQNAEQGKSLSAHVTVTSGEASAGTLLSSNILGTDNANVTTTLTTPGQAVSTTEEAVLASTTDDYGTSYYYRGAVTNNYVVFANMCWRVVRVTGNGAIKLVLYNYNPNSVSNPCDTTQDGTSNAFARYSGTTYKSVFNTSERDNAYIGFMYGTTGSSTYAATHANINKSNILTNLETWYTTYLSSYADNLADTIWCNDKSTTSITDGYNTIGSEYQAYQRLASPWVEENTSSPSLICSNDNNGGNLSKFTVDDTTYGNGALTDKIGLLTADEIAYAGGSNETLNTTYYLYKNSSLNEWWTISPYYYDDGSYMFYVSPDSGLMGNLDISVSQQFGLRPAISLVSTTKVTGSGTNSDPYVVQ